METKQIEIRCPHCAAQLVVDVLTRKVLRSAKPEQVDETGKARLDEGRWDAAKGRVQERTSGATDGLDRALEAERGKRDRLDDLFDKARDKLRGREDEDPTR